MLLKFLENTRYSEDGHTVKRGHKNEIRYVAHATAVALLNGRKAVTI